MLFLTKEVKLTLLQSAYDILSRKGAVDILLIKEVEYAVMILNTLHKESPLPASVLSERNGIPSPFIYRVLKKLEAADILDIKRGARGGYSIKKDCGELTLYDVISAFENTFLVIECMKSHYDCVHNKNTGCCMHREFGRMQGILRQEFKRNSLAVLFSE